MLKCDTFDRKRKVASLTDNYLHKSHRAEPFGTHTALANFVHYHSEYLDSLDDHGVLMRAGFKVR